MHPRAQVVLIHICSNHGSRERVGPQLMSKFYISLHRDKSIKIYFFENKLTGKYNACAEATSDGEGLGVLSHDQ